MWISTSKMNISVLQILYTSIDRKTRSNDPVVFYTPSCSAMSYSVHCQIHTMWFSTSKTHISVSSYSTKTCALLDINGVGVYICLQAIVYCIINPVSVCFSCHCVLHQNSIFNKREQDASVFMLLLHSSIVSCFCSQLFYCFPYD